MARALDLDAGGYAGTYKLIGGTLALDFANLVSYRDTDRAHDWLDPVANVVRWARAAGLETAAAGDTGALLELRESLARTFLALADGGHPAAGDVERLGSIAAAASARRRLHFPAGADAAAWHDAEPSLIGELALDAAALLTSAASLRRVSACDECRWLYLDTTRNRSRRWCDPADCGNRARQRRHYHRTRPAQVSYGAATAD